MHYPKTGEPLHALPYGSVPRTCLRLPLGRSETKKPNIHACFMRCGGCGHRAIHQIRQQVIEAGGTGHQRLSTAGSQVAMAGNRKIRTRIRTLIAM